jgi:hypothetical protein
MVTPAFAVLEEDAAVEIEDPDPEANEDSVLVAEVDLDSVAVPVDVTSSVETEMDESVLEWLSTPDSVVWLGAVASVTEDPVIIAVDGEVVVAAA